MLFRSRVVATLGLVVLAVAWAAQRRRGRVKGVISPQPEAAFPAVTIASPSAAITSEATQSESTPPQPSPAIPLQTQQEPAKPEEMGDIEEF